MTGLVFDEIPRDPIKNREYGENRTGRSNSRRTGRTRSTWRMSRNR